uniref:Peptidase_S9_N domain-containing protein n=1 Tax=Parastrongyloides trichosuri TaxID=131310 RepID=A0A0N4Z1H9_PARTI
MILFFKKYCIFILTIALIFVSKDGVRSEGEVSAKDSEMIEIISGGLLNTSVYPDIYRNESEGETFSNNITVQDPYRYLDNDSYIANKTEFISKLNNISLTYFTNVSSYNDIKNKVEKYMHYERYDVLGKHGNYYYYLYNNGSQETDILIQTDNYTNIRNATKFVDLNNKTQSGEYLLTKAAFSSDGNIIAYAVSENGSDSNTIYFKYQNGTELNDTIKGVIYSEITFVFNGTGFIYSKYNDTDENEEDGNVSKKNESLSEDDESVGEDDESLSEDNVSHTMYFHKMGTDQTQDIPIVNSTDKWDIIDGSVSPDGKYLFATFWIGGSDEN